jgi:hypothetical protein
VIDPPIALLASIVTRNTHDHLDQSCHSVSSAAIILLVVLILFPPDSLPSVIVNLCRLSFSIVWCQSSVLSR